MSNHTYDISAILDKIAPRVEQLVKELYPEARKQGTTMRIGSPDGERGSSLSVSLKPNNAGTYLDFGDRTIRGNVFGLVAMRHNLTYRGAIEWLANYAGVAPTQQFDRPKPKAPDQSLTLKLCDLGPNVIAYAQSRSISEETLRAYSVGSDKNDKYVAMPHFWDDGIGLLKMWSVKGKRGVDGRDGIYTNSEPVHTLFGKELVDPAVTAGEVIITEGQWDAMSFFEAGLPAVSIPSGAENMQWITVDYDWLAQFTTVFLSFDNDQAGQQALQIAKARLGAERCKVVKLGRKDANDVLCHDGAAALIAAHDKAREASVELLVQRAALKEQTKHTLSSDESRSGMQVFCDDMPMFFRPHEWTLWFGASFHGKSQAIQNQIIAQAAVGHSSMIASFEQPPPYTFASMLVGWTADPSIAHRKWYDEAFDSLSEHVEMFDSMQRTKPDALIATMTQAHKQLGINSFFVDNVMTLDVDRGDNTAQAETADKFRVFVATYPVHVHLVAHPRKAAPDQGNKPPGQNEIRGAAEWGDQPHNVIVVWRDRAKHEKLAQMAADRMDRMEIESLDTMLPDGKIIVVKQRSTGETPMAKVWFNKQVKRFTPQRLPVITPLWPAYAETRARFIAN